MGGPREGKSRGRKGEGEVGGGGLSREKLSVTGVVSLS